MELPGINPVEVRTLKDLIVFMKAKANYEQTKNLLKDGKLETFLNQIGEDECAFFAGVVGSDISLFIEFAGSRDIMSRLSLIEHPPHRLGPPGAVYLEMSQLRAMGNPVMKRFALASYIAKNIKRPVLEEFVRNTEKAYGQNPPGNINLKIGGGFLKKSIYIKGDNFSLVKRILHSSNY